MNKKTILRNDLILTQDYIEQFRDGAFESDIMMTVEEGDGDCCVISVFDGANDEDDISTFLLNKDDAERFAQAILIHSGSRRIAKSQVLRLITPSQLIDEVIDEFYGKKLVVFDKENNCYEFPENDYWIPADDFNDTKLAIGWFAHLSEKNWVTPQHINHLANLIRNRKSGS